MFAKKSPEQKRAEFRAALKSGKLLRFPGAFSPLVAMAIQRHGFEGVYVSGAALAADLGLPDIGLTTLPEVASRGGAIARATDLPALIDADTGFGEALNVARTIQTLEDSGQSGCHLEDQVNPKRCGHLDHKSLVATQTMVEKIRAAVAARRDRNFVIMARTDARASEGPDGAIARARAYVDAGADAISLINTFVAMAIDAETRRPRISHIVGGLSGPAIKPIALRMVYEAVHAVAIPVIGIGGISTAVDVVEFMLAGAAAVEIGTASFWDPCATEKIVDALEGWCLEHRVTKITELVGGLKTE